MGENRKEKLVSGDSFLMPNAKKIIGNGKK
jgi:hypothetical protein